jgi:3-hydroxyacyl-CoA dehydrogenase/enoyl-CoA hydratase/3-hydroxybutyryl-CoA epimerase
MNEAITLLEEGAEIAALDRALKDFGFPVGPVALLDEVGIDVAAHVSKDLGNAFRKRGLAPSETLHRLFEAGYKGRKNGKGFYRYTSEKKKEVNEEIYTFFGGVDRKELKADAMAERLTLMMVNEAVHCLGEGILASARDGDAGAILGLGFPPFRGGPFRYVDETGIAEVLEKLASFAGTHGPRFKPAPLLLKMAKTGKRFHAE